MNQNTFLGDSFLNSKYLDPNYLFAHMVDFFRSLFNLFFGSGSGPVMGALAIFAVFFLAIIAYCSVRLLEIRAKEKRHLEHEIAEYAAHQADRDKKL